MTVKELIEQLQTLPQCLPVVLHDREYREYNEAVELRKDKLLHYRFGQRVGVEPVVVLTD